MHDFPKEPLHERVEKIESIKAGSLGGIAAGVSYGLMLTVVRVASALPNRLMLHEYSRSIVSLGLEVSIAIVSGFLFGVTYRYIIRTDRNDHLNAGAVLAFGLIRGLARIDVDEFELAQIWIDGLIVGKSILLFSIARYTLDYALAASWVLPFAQHSQSASLVGVASSAKNRSVSEIELSEMAPQSKTFTERSVALSLLKDRSIQNPKSNQRTTLLQQIEVNHEE